MPKSNAKKPPASSSEMGVLSSHTKLDGQIEFAGLLRIDGSIDGNINEKENSSSTLVIGKSAEIKGDINCSSIVISGIVHGNITALNKVDILLHGTVHGDIETGKLSIESGAEYQGSCRMLSNTAEVDGGASATNSRQD